MTCNHRALEESEIALIERVKLSTCLYDPRNADFRLAYKKEQEWVKVAYALGISPEAAKRRWTCLRDRYSRELKQLRIHPDAGFGHNQFFKTMDFLRTFVKKRREKRTLKDCTIKKDASNWEAGLNDSSSTKQSPNHDYKMDIHIETEENMENVDITVLEHPPDGNKITTTQEANLVDNQEYEFQVEEEYDESDFPKMPILTKCPNGISNTTSVQSLIAAPKFTVTPCQANMQYSTKTVIGKAIPAESLSRTQMQYPEVLISSPAIATSKEASYNEDDFFCKSIAGYLRQLNRRHKIKAKVEMFQILEKYIELEETANENKAKKKCVDNFLG